MKRKPLELEVPSPRLNDFIAAAEQAGCAALLTFSIAFVEALEDSGFPWVEPDPAAPPNGSPVPER